MHRETWKFSASAKRLAKTRTVVDAVLAEQHPDDGSKLITKKKNTAGGPINREQVYVCVCLLLTSH